MRVGRRAHKWWPRLAWFLFGIGISNAYGLYKQKTADPVDQKTFRKQLMVAMIGSFTARKKRGRKALTQTQAHHHEHDPINRKTHSDCAVCRKKRKYKNGEHAPQTREGCASCNIGVHFACWKEHISAPVDG